MDPLSVVLKSALDAAQGVPYFPLILAGVFLVVVIAIVFAVSLTARRRAEERMAHIIRAYDVVTAQLAEAERIGHFGSFVWDILNPAESYWTPEMYDLFGFVARRKAPSLDAFVEAAHKDDKKTVDASWEKAQKAPGSFDFTMRIVLPNTKQTRYLRIEGKNIRDHNGIVARIQGIAHDVTRETEIDRAKSEFVSLASHQLKTPVTAMKWLSELLLQKGADPLSSTQRTYLENIHEEGQHMIDIVNDMLNVSRIELDTFAARIEEFDINELAQSVLKEQIHVADQKKVAVSLVVASDLPHLKADKFLMRMVFQNLLSNAIKYTPQGGKVDCEVSRASTTREMLFIRVTDSGIGIPKSEWGNIFKKLYRAQNAQDLVPDGTGLGLYVVKMILERNHGGISFESTVGKGSTFYASVPFEWQDATVEKHALQA